jgi:glycerate kinase
MRALIAFDKFKDALDASAACAAAAAAVRDVHPDWDIDLCPLADGGDGFVEVLTRAAGGQFHRTKVTGPRGGQVEASFGVADVPPAVREIVGARRVAIVEMAQASGLALLPPAQRDPWQTSTRGTGELLRAAANAGVEGILLGVGGSATHDVGLGALSILGLSCHEVDGKRVELPIPQTWAAVASISGKIDPSLPPIVIACDVNNPLMGTFGAANVFAAQKGMLPEDFTRLEYMTGRMAALLTTNAGKHPLLCETPGTGAAGGLAFGLHCAAGAKLAPGAELVTAWLDLDARLARADLVLTGEGRFDATSLQGKAPGALAQRALAAGKRVHVFAGAVSGTLPGAHLHAITPESQSLPEALRATAANLRAAVRAALGGRQ